MIEAVIQCVLGCAILVLSAHYFILASVKIAHHFRFPPLFVGICFVGFGTSLPEIFASTLAAIKQQPAIAIGNAIGSNIVNIGLVLGITALITPLAIHKKTLRKDMPFLIFVIGITFAIFWSGSITRTEGGMLLALLIGYFIYKIKDKSLGPVAAQNDKTPLATTQLWKFISLWCVSIIALLLSADSFIAGATQLALHFGISRLTIGLTVVATGTSLPELASTLAAVMHNEPDIAIGNIIGSNIFNLLAVMAMPALITPGPIPHQLLTRDLPVMAIYCLVPWLLPKVFRTGNRINRMHGAALVLSYLGYLTWLNKPF